MTRVELPWPAQALKVNGGGKFGVRARFAKSKAARVAKGDAHTLAYAAGKPALPADGPIRVQWTLHPPDRWRRDMDNLIAALKWHQDGVAAAWGVDDARFEPAYRWGEIVPGGRVVVEVLP